MNVSHLTIELRKFLQRLNVSRVGKLLVILQVAVLCTLLLTWPPVTLTLVVPEPEVEAWQSLIDDFHHQNPKIAIKLAKNFPDPFYTTDDVQTIYSVDLGNFNPSSYDLIYMDIIWVSQFANAGWLKDLSNEFKKAEQEKFLKGDLDGGLYQEKLYRIPVNSDVGMLYYRKDLLEAAKVKPPETFSDLDNILQNKKIQDLQKKQKIKWGYLWQGEKYEGLVTNFVEVLQSYEGFWIEPNTLEVGLDKKEAIAAVEFLVNSIKNGISPQDVDKYKEKDSWEKFQNGDGIFLRHWASFLTKPNQKLSLEKIGIKSLVNGSCQGGWGLGIPKNSKHPNEAWKAIKYFTSEEAQHKLLDKGYLPSMKKIFEEPEIANKYPHELGKKALAEVWDNVVLRPGIPQYALASDILQNYLYKAIKNEGKPEEVMKEAAAKTRQCLKDIKKCDLVS